MLAVLRAQGGIRTHNPSRATHFECAAYAVPPLGQVVGATPTLSAGSDTIRTGAAVELALGWLTAVAAGFSQPTQRAQGGSRTLTPLSGHQALNLACLPFHHLGQPSIVMPGVLLVPRTSAAQCPRQELNLHDYTDLGRAPLPVGIRGRCHQQVACAACARGDSNSHAPHGAPGPEPGVSTVPPRAPTSLARRLERVRGC